MRLNSNECFCQQSFKANLTYSDPYNELLIELDDIREKSISLSTKMYIALHSNIFDGSCIKISNWLNITTKFLKSQEAFLKLKKELTKEGKFQVIHFYQNLKEIKKNYDKTIPELFDVLHYVISLEEKKLNYYQDKRERAEKAGMSTAECMKLNHVIFKIQEKIKLLKNIRDRWLQLVGSELWDFSARLFNIRFLYVKKESSAKHLCFQGYTEN
ncbi:hypothetical protein HMI54_007957 [Coelomomyces lativittatus]|nr:hypothetical protein HMI54_007957 [Coelomomyces lativittatus]